MRYRAPPATALATVRLDEFTAVYHRPSGATHMLVEPAPEILAALVEPLTLDELADRLAVTYELAGDAGALAARVDELVAAGLVAPA